MGSVVLVQSQWQTGKLCVDKNQHLMDHAMGRPYTAWWLRYPGRTDHATELLAKFTPAIERQVRYWEGTCPGEIDWAPVLWDAAYRAAWRCDGPNFWPLLHFMMKRKVAQYLQTRDRKQSKLKRIDLEPLEFDAAVSGMEYDFGGNRAADARW